MRETATDRPGRHRLTVGDFYRMAETGILGPDERVELIAGEIIDVPPPGSRHAGMVKHLARIFHAAVEDAAIVQVQDPLSLGEYSEPQPDIALLRFEADFYRSAHPHAGNTLLVVEIADTSLIYDRDVKMPLYARHGVPEAWLVDIERGVLTRYREPRADTYAQIDEPDLAAPVEIDALPGIRVDLAGVVTHPVR